MTAKVLAVLGTMSSVGKSLLTAIISYHFAKKGLKVSPFKAQNMSLNAFATTEGEMAYAQVFQAWAAGRKPSVKMNPLLLKPLGNMTSEIIFLGKTQGILPSGKFQKFKAGFKKQVFSVFEDILAENDLVVIEGAGGLAELNLLKNDFVNYEIVSRYQIPFLLVGDIDRGGIFAQIWGTYELVPELKPLSVGFAINKFRGAPELFEDGIKILEHKTQKPCLGLLPFLTLKLFEEDSASLGLPNQKFSSGPEKLKIAVVYYPHISNYLDFDPLKFEPDVEVILTAEPQELLKAHVIILPGSKNTMASLNFLREKGLSETIKSLSRQKILIGLCGGFQILGQKISDEGVENLGEVPGLALLPHETRFFRPKIATAQEITLNWPFFQGNLKGFEIRYGRSFLGGQEISHLFKENIFGSYLHGIFYEDDFRHAFLSYVRDLFGFEPRPKTFFHEFVQQQITKICKDYAFKRFLSRLEKALFIP
ncbi:cobyric acid synthase CobQ [Thermodesulfatator indicus DSM 15286]|uniref:Cobyric acid synthase n=1 Tax=Thermodesulfatator indicus (strain DSM 15286 / JCM 11887 / CIR29812) TaxID=667014 RepID=F8ACJ7_THEID|nr:cobyric acid synthase [Thermodesulfatator indicus]AEH44701.1 cobyric acid synthase CobQ [Thermodesulfatator indicus DSM 15286]